MKQEEMLAEIAYLLTKCREDLREAEAEIFTGLQEDAEVLRSLTDSDKGVYA